MIHPLPGSHGGGVATQVSDFVQNALRSIGRLFGGDSAPASNTVGSGDNTPAKSSEARVNTDDQLGATPKLDRLAVGGTVSDRRVRQQGHNQPTFDDVVFSVQAGVDRVIGSVVRH